MLKYIKYPFYGILFLVVFFAIYLFLAFILSKISVNDEPQKSSDVTIYILTNGVHTDLVVPIRNEQMDWSKEVLFENTVGKDSLANYLAMGWGDKGFYLETPTWADLKFSVGFKAATGLSTTAIHATYYKKMTEAADCVKLQISKEQYGKLINYITNSFQKDNNGQFIPIKTNANYGKTDAFYEANGSYSMLHTCNTWANSGLKACEQKAALWTPFDSGIFDHYRK